MILFFAMMLGCLTIGGYANGIGGGSISIDSNADIVTLTDGNTYNVIRTAEEFLAMQSGEKYILANDIDFDGMDVTDHTLIDLTKIELDGNYHSLLNYSAQSGHGGMFAMYNADNEVYEVKQKTELL